MLMRIINDNFGRYVFPLFYKEMADFSEEMDVHGDFEVILKQWQARWALNDENLIFLVDFDEEKNDIIAHAVITIEANGNNKIVNIHQWKNKKSKNNFPSEFFEYIDKLVYHHQAIGSFAFVKKHSKALSKFGYEDIKTFVFKKAKEMS